MNQNVQPHSGAWVTFTYVSFSASAFMVAIGVFFLPLDLWIKGYLAMGIVMLVQSCVTLTKTIRDMHEGGNLEKLNVTLGARAGEGGRRVSQHPPPVGSQAWSRNRCSPASRRKTYRKDRLQ